MFVFKMMVFISICFGIDIIVFSVRRLWSLSCFAEQQVLNTKFRLFRVARILSNM